MIDKIKKQWLFVIITCLFFITPLGFAKNDLSHLEKKAASIETQAKNNQTANDAEIPRPPEQTIKDPLEGFNRAMFQFNDWIDTYFMKPVSALYNKIMPRPLNQGIHNFFNNVQNFPTIANDILQLHFYQMANDSWRLLINTTLGIGGLFDIAERIGLPPYTNDFGLTLAYWGWRDSAYLVLPFWGPNTIRDSIRHPVDYFAFSIYPHIYPARTRYELYALSVLDARAQLLKFEPIVREAVLDKYVFMRNAFYQRRQYQVEKNQQLRAGDPN